ncbi:MAG: hypothetical protein HKN47_15655 [Pirellulaceae bacterium]|nr:hypothetical protein [Pirellulaceae bacterium]
MLRLDANNYAITIENDSDYSVGSADNVRQYDREIALDATSGYTTTSRHAITVFDGDRILTSVILLAGGGASGVHEHSAIVVDDTCFVAVGPYVVSLSIPTLEMRWSTESDSATCFGVYYAGRHELLISHGELEIAALRTDGRIVWSSGGADIFTNGFDLRDDAVRVRDWDNRDYWFDIKTGTENRG